MKRLLPLVSAAAVLLAGCGGQPQPVPTPAVAKPLSPATAVGEPGTLIIGQQGTIPPRTAWYTRIETPTAVVVAETAHLTGPIALARALAAGRYRVIAWHRTCADTCPITGEQGLGPLEEICGALVEVKEKATLTATIAIDPVGACSVTAATGR